MDVLAELIVVTEISLVTIPAPPMLSYQLFDVQHVLHFRGIFVAEIPNYTDGIEDIRAVILVAFFCVRVTGTFRICRAKFFFLDGRVCNGEFAELEDHGLYEGAPLCGGIIVCDFLLKCGIFFGEFLLKLMIDVCDLLLDTVRATSPTPRGDCANETTENGSGNTCYSADDGGLNFFIHRLIPEHAAHCDIMQRGHRDHVTLVALARDKGFSTFRQQAMFVQPTVQ